MAFQSYDHLDTLQLSRFLFEHTSEAMGILTQDAVFVTVNQAFCQIVGLSMDEIIGRNVSEFPISAFTQGRFDEVVNEVQHGGLWTGCVEGRRVDQRPFVLLAIVRAITPHAKNAQGLIVSLWDLESVDYLPGPVCLVDRDDKIVYANARCALFWGVADHRDLIGESLVMLMTVDNEQHVRERLEHAFSGRYNSMTEGVLRSQDGSVRYYEGVSFPIDFSGVRFVQVIFNEVTERKLAEQALTTMAYYDEVTKLPNRNQLRAQLRKMIQEAARQQRKIALFYLRFTGLSSFNNIYTTTEGNLLVQSAVQRVQRELSEEDHLFRYTEQDFIVVVIGHHTAEQCIQKAQNLLLAFQTPIQSEETTYLLQLDIGINALIEDGGDPKSAVREAYIANRRARAMGKYQLSITSPDLNSQAYRSFRLGKDLHQAILHNQFVLYYQPRVDAKTFEVVSGEALLRWQHPEFGMVSPAEFIPLAEATGLIVKLGEWVIEQVLLAYQSWQTITCKNFTLSLNVSGEQLINFGFQDRVDALFSRAGIDRQAIEFEITESLFTDRHDQFQTTIHSLQVQGNRIALDDFGTGFSSLSRLKDLPCEVLKIDRSFVLHISIREDDRIIVEAVIKLAHALGMTVVAEGVETIEQLRLLQEVDCDEIQGYLFSRPVPAEQFEQILLGKKITIG